MCWAEIIRGCNGVNREGKKRHRRVTGRTSDASSVLGRYVLMLQIDVHTVVQILIHCERYSLPNNLCVTK
jgi:hypothetical protein